MRLQELLTEGPHDPNRLKAVFMAGGPGSGKTYVAKRLLGGTGLKHVNIDDFYEFLRKNRVTSGGYDKELYDYSWNLMRKRMKLYLDGQLGVVIDITGRRLDRLLETKKELENLGYDTMCVIVNTDVKKALDRNEMRHRKVDPNLLKKMHSEVQQNVGKIQQIFQGKVLLVDNTEDKQNFDYERRVVDKFLSATNRNDFSKFNKDPKDYIGEALSGDDLMALKYKETTEFLIKNCQPYFKAVGSPITLAYRGRRGNSDAVMPSIDKYRADRIPQDSPQILHRIFDKAIESAGLVANRSNSIFVTGDKDYAKKYGMVYVVFPIGEFNYTWSKSAKDWFMAFHKARPDMFASVSSLSTYTYNIFKSRAEEKRNIRIKTQAEKVDRWQKEDAPADYIQRARGLIELWKNMKDNELVKWYLENEAEVGELRADDLDASIIDVKKFVPDILGDDGSLWNALMVGNEIMLSAKGGYLYIPETFFWKYVVHYLQSAGIKVK